MPPPRWFCIPSRKNGTMNNRVTFATYKLFQARGFSVMRFNFRGVGRSQGSFEQGEGG